MGRDLFKSHNKAVFRVWQMGALENVSKATAELKPTYLGDASGTLALFVRWGDLTCGRA